MNSAINQRHFTLHRGNINATIKIHHPTRSTTSMTTNPLTSHPQTRGNPGTNGRTIQNLSIVPIHRVGLTIPKPPPNTTVTMTLPTSLPPNHSLHSPPTVHVNLHKDQAQSNLVPPPVPSPQDMFPSIFKMVQERNGLVISSMPLNHPDRMRAANELKAEERPQPTTSIPQDEYDAAREQLHQVDSRIPGDVLEKAVQLFFSTNLLPDYDLSTCYVRELPHTNMLALIMPLPDISRFSMPPPFDNQHNHTWALCHGTTIKTAQLILLEGKIRPANWSYHKNPQKCHLPTFGAFYLGREISNADKTLPTWVETALLDSIEKRAKANRTSPWAQCIEEPMSTPPFELVATKKPKSTWATKA